MSHSLKKITKTTHNIELDLKYATKNNVTGDIIYKNAECYLHEKALKSLELAIELARNLGLRFKIFDAFRPIEAQWILWNHIKNPHYISHPEQGSVPHCRGVAIDLTLIDNNDQELDMGTEFDDFSDQSHHANVKISKDAQKNRLILLGIMTLAGWDFYKNEWWHYQLFNARDYTIISDKESNIGIM